MSQRATPRASSARVAAQAKVNLRLRILAREAAGYHQIETLFLRLALADDVTVRATDGARSLDVTGEVDARQLGPVERNLAWRAAVEYATATGWPAGFGIELEKRIPVGGGLGGGSADAGAILRALDALAPSPAGESALLEIASRLGADVPFLTSTAPYALAWGRGERMLALPVPEEREVLLVLPPFAVNTGAAYGWLAAARESDGRAETAAAALSLGAVSDWSGIDALATNDFEAVVAERHPSIAAIVQRLRSLGCAPALMSGSGSSVFGILPRGRGVELPRFGDAASESAPRVVLTRSAVRVAPVIVAAD
ncbi:MAG TPA: 4-(cytidine 5'-diphospho)-2-C-methyl-D-erythritol kinase [Gemmatimonadaceae bacterium]